MNNLIIDCFAGGGGASVGIEMALGRPARALITGRDSDEAADIKNREVSLSIPHRGRPALEPHPE